MLKANTDRCANTGKERCEWFAQSKEEAKYLFGEIIIYMSDDGGVIPGVLTLGMIDDGITYIIDGQHRIEAAKLSGCAECYADVRICKFESMAAMGEEFVHLNSAIVRMNSDDVLRGLEGTEPSIGVIRRRCEFVGYDNIRRTPTSALLSMATVLRCWSGSASDTPSPGHAAIKCASETTSESAEQLSVFLLTVRSAWGNDMEYSRLWGALNLTMMMWLWRRLVIDRERSGNTRYVALSPDQFKRCAMSVSADSNYVEWLVGRAMGERDRTPCYQRLKTIFVARLAQDNPRAASKPKLPQPAWGS
jgi:hypothetical protein